MYVCITYVAIPADQLVGVYVIIRIRISSSYGDYDPQPMLPNGPDILPHLSSDQQVLSQPGDWPNYLNKLSTAGFL